MIARENRLYFFYIFKISSNKKCKFVKLSWLTTKIMKKKIMKKNEDNSIKRKSAVLILLLFIFGINYAQQSDNIVIPELNIVPNGLNKTSLQFYGEKSVKLKQEIGKLAEEKKALNLKCKSLKEGSPEDKQCQSELASFTTKLNNLTQRVNTFDNEIEEVVYKDSSLDKLSIITYYTLKKNQKSWDEFQRNVSTGKTKLSQDKIIIQQELTKIKSQKQKTKIPFEEGVILSVCDGMNQTNALEDTLKSPFTGVCYKNLGTGVVFVSFSGAIIQTNDWVVAGSKTEKQPESEAFSLASTEAKTALNELKEKKFVRLIAHSNGATVAECLLKDSLVEIKELNIIGGDKSLINGQALQQLLDNGMVKRIVVWINLNDPNTWVTPIDNAMIMERTANFFSYKNKFKWEENKLGDSKVEYKWILGKGSLNALSEHDPEFVNTYFKEIAKEFFKK